jgi:hypothetical protein
MKLSNGLKNLFMPLMEIIKHNIDLVDEVANVIEKELKAVGKRGNGPYYPCDLKRVKMEIETVHDVTGLIMLAPVVNGDFDEAIKSLQRQMNDEDYIIDLDGLHLHS